MKRHVAAVDASLLSSIRPNSRVYTEGTDTRLLSELHDWTRKFNLQAKIFATDHTSPFHVQVTVQRDKFL